MKDPAVLCYIGVMDKYLRRVHVSLTVELYVRDEESKDSIATMVDERITAMDLPSNCKMSEVRVGDVFVDFIRNPEKL